MSERMAALAYAAFEGKDYAGAARYVEDAISGGSEQAVHLRAFSAFVAYKRRDYGAALRALEETFAATGGQMGEMAIALFVRLHLLAGDPERAWKLVRQGCQLKAFGPPLYGLPRWEGAPGEPLDGRRFVVWGAGYGDDMLYARFIPRMARAGATVHLNCRPRLVRLFSSLEGVAGVHPFETEVADVDFQIHLAELPALFEAHRAENVWDGAYLHAAPRRLEGEGRRVGIVWGADSQHFEAQERSASLAEMSPLAEVPGVRLCSLQFGPHAEQLSPPPAGMNVEELAKADRDFADAAATIASMDLVITIDTATANLAGAMGKPVWVAVPYNPDWRWTLDGDTTPWYPTARVYRQTKAGEWRSVFRAMADDLAAGIDS